MREIKFRAWDEGNKVMHNDFQFIRSGVKGNDWIIFISDKFPLSNEETNPFSNPNPYCALQLEIMQYTGFKDKNGTCIYEGDILSSKSDGSNGYDIWDYKDILPIIVKWDNTGFNMLSNLFEKESIYSFKHIEVIGNIYDNPELLDK